MGETGQLIGMTQLVLQECAETQKWHLLEDVDGSIQGLLGHPTTKCLVAEVLIRNIRWSVALRRNEGS
jgi:hypothetical protein